MRRDPIRELKTRALLYAILGVLVILLGIKYQLPVCTFFLVIAVLAWFFLNRALAFLLGAGNLDREQMRRFQQAFQQQFERHNVPRQVFWLLFAVAGSGLSYAAMLYRVGGAS